MKERPILFNTEMVQASLEGRKTQFRWVVKPQPDLVGNDGPITVHTVYGFSQIKSPFGQVGDRLWVRETFETDGDFAKFKTGRVRYRADYPDGKNPCGLPWTPSIHMPRWASRILLEITDIRVERVQEISEEDVKAEGTPVFKPTGAIRTINGKRQMKLVACLPTPSNQPTKDDFHILWNSIYAKRGSGWDVNPWVWALNFKVLDSVELLEEVKNNG